MDIRNKLKLSEASSTHLCCFQEGKHLRLYQGALYWAKQQGLEVRPKCRELKSLRGGRLLLAEFNEQALLCWLREHGLNPLPVAWGWRVALTEPRCLLTEQVWVDEQAALLPAIRWRPHKEEPEPSVNEQLKELLGEVRRWPVGELPPMQAVKAIRRWQERLMHLPGFDSSEAS